MEIAFVQVDGLVDVLSSPGVVVDVHHHVGLVFERPVQAVPHPVTLRGSSQATHAHMTKNAQGSRRHRN